jgi:hypothetical protein
MISSTWVCYEIINKNIKAKGSVESSLLLASLSHQPDYELGTEFALRPENMILVSICIYEERNRGPMHFWEIVIISLNEEY